MNPANRLGLDYRREAERFPWKKPIVDAHVHLSGMEAARRFFEVAEWFGIQRVWSQSPVEEIDALRETFGDRFEFVAVPNYARREEPETFASDWLRRLEAYANKGVRIAKFWAAPRGVDIHPALTLGHPLQREKMRLARELGMMFMVHVADPDIWFATVYRDASRYGTKAQHYERLEELLEEFSDVLWLAAHMAGHPEDLEHVQGLLERYPHLYVDVSAAKWMVRELSKRIGRFAEFCRRNRGRVLFGSDIVVRPGDDPSVALDLYASRYWVFRTLLETEYRGPSPIVDPDLQKEDPSRPGDATAWLCGAGLDESVLEWLYGRAAEGLLRRWRKGEKQVCQCGEGGQRAGS